MNIKDIKAELVANLATYNDKTDAEVVPLLKAIELTPNRTSISGSELFGYTDQTEYEALTDPEKQQWLGLCGIDTITKDAIPLIQSIVPLTWAKVVKTDSIFPFARVNEGDVRKARNS